MDLVPSDKMKALKTPVWDEYKKIINQAEGKIVSVAMISKSNLHLLFAD